MGKEKDFNCSDYQKVLSGETPKGRSHEACSTLREASRRFLKNPEDEFANSYLSGWMKEYLKAHPNVYIAP